MFITYVESYVKIYQDNSFECASRANRANRTIKPPSILISSKLYDDNDDRQTDSGFCGRAISAPTRSLNVCDGDLESLFPPL